MNSVRKANANPRDQRIFILAPTGRDSELMARFRHWFRVIGCGTSEDHPLLGTRNHLSGAQAVFGPDCLCSPAKLRYIPGAWLR